MISFRSAALVTVQGACLVAIVAAGPYRPLPAWAWGVAAAGIALGTWAVAVMRPSRLRVMPEPGAGHPLVTSGPYRVLRHPMYTAVLLAALALAGGQPTTIRCAAWAGLLAVFVAKLRLEERLLRQAFPAYADYARRTWRLLPWIY